MINDRQINISTGGSRKATNWQQQSLMWSEFCDKLRTPVRSPESLQEFMAFAKSRQDELKDVGGFVGGALTGCRRKASAVSGRDLVTLDMDNIPTGGTEDVLRRVASLGCASAVYSTRKHSDYAPRLRAVIPLDRTAAPDEYEPIARQLAKLIGIQFCDPTTFEPSRLMYWPSVSADAVYVCEVQDSPFCSADGILAMYEDWKDITAWPQVPGAEAIEKRRLAKQEDPTKKRGIVGAFCRTYSIRGAMETFIAGMYEPTADPNRYTYTGGSTTGGAVIYDGDLFMFSHHATDPCSGQLVNAWDLIRLHMYGERDDEAKPGTPVAKLPSFTAMKQLAAEDPQVGRLMAREREEHAREVFSADTGLGAVRAENDAQSGAETADWLSGLELDGNGNYKKTINNLVMILRNDPMLKGKIVTDEFFGCGMVTGGVPWDPDSGRRRWVDRDDDGARWYFETRYNIPSRDKIESALSIVGGEHHVNAVRDYLMSLEWDGTRRVDYLLPDYLGAEDTPYTRAVMRKSLAAAVSRAVEGGTKYDCMPILAGPQGIGKSTFLALLGRDWFSDSLTSFEGKDAAELIQGVWIVEVGELTAMTRQETNAVKQFLSKRADIYRAAYGRRTEEHLRRCVFFGTSNDSEFLKDITGNRRFWPVDVGVHKPTRNVWEEMPSEVDQIWAEAVLYWRMGEKLYMEGELAKFAEEAQESHREMSELEGLIRDYLELRVPENWSEMNVPARRMFLQGNASSDGELVEMDRICAAEIWTVCLGNPPGKINRRDSREINGILKNIEGWEPIKSTGRFGVFGIQRGYARRMTPRKM